MCQALYIAADTPLPLIPWDEESSQPLVVRELRPAEEAVRSHFSKSHVYFVGTYEGCGCAFNFGRDYPDWEVEEEELVAARQSIDSLSSYIRETGAEELYWCSSEEEDEPPASFRRVTLEQLRSKAFAFQERELLTIEAYTA